MRPTNSHQGGFELLYLQTNQIITRYAITSVTITPSVIKQAYSITKEDKIPTRLKIRNRVNKLLFGTSWTVGVDYYRELFNEQMEEEDCEEEVPSESEDEDNDRF